MGVPNAPITWCKIIVPAKDDQTQRWCYATCTDWNQILIYMILIPYLLLHIYNLTCLVSRFETWIFVNASQTQYWWIMTQSSISIQFYVSFEL